MTKRRDLLIRLASKAYEFREEPFELKSGGTSQHYVDCRPMMLDPVDLALAGELIAGAVDWNHQHVAFIAGVVLGGCTLAMAVAQRLDQCSTIFVRPEPKAHGKKSRLEMPQIMKEKQGRVPGILIEDVITSGGSALNAMTALEEEGFDVVSIYCLVNRSDRTWIAGGTPIHAVATLQELSKL